MAGFGSPFFLLRSAYPMRAFARSNHYVGAQYGAADRNYIAPRKQRVGLIEFPRLAVVEFDLDSALFAVRETRHACDNGGDAPCRTAVLRWVQPEILRLLGFGRHRRHHACA